MRLQAGNKAPDFSEETLKGDRITLEALRGKTVLLKFFRYASCPICNLLVREYQDQADVLTQAGITTILVFHSPRSALEKKLKTDVSFEVITDPDKHLYRQFGVEASWKGFLYGKMWVDYTRAIVRGFLSSLKFFFNEGGDVGIPADFLIDGEGVIRHAHYGNHYSDTLTVSDSLRLAQELNLATG